MRWLYIILLVWYIILYYIILYLYTYDAITYTTDYSFRDTLQAVYYLVDRHKHVIIIIMIIYGPAGCLWAVW
jgi:myosin-crossreactive antigen